MADERERRRRWVLPALLALAGALLGWLLGSSAAPAPREGEPIAAAPAPERPPAPLEASAPLAAAPAIPAAAPPPRPPADAGSAPHPFGFCDPPGSRPQLPALPAEQLPLAAKQALDEHRRARAEGRSAEAIAALRRAQAAAPQSDLVALLLGGALTETTHLAEAREVLSAYLRRHPDDQFHARRLARLGTMLEIQGGNAEVESRGVTLSYPPAQLTRERAWQTAEEVRRALDDAATLTGTPPRRELTVLVYADRSELLAVACVQAWSGGLFDGTLRLVAQDGAIAPAALRHESLHAQVVPHSRRAPRWFDEGLAQWFSEPAPSRHGALGLLARNRTWIPFASLEGSFQVFEAGEDAGLAYAQSAAMVRWLVEAQGAPVIERAVRFFEGGGRPEGLLAALDPSGGLSEAAFAAWIRGGRGE